MKNYGKIYTFYTLSFIKYLRIILFSLFIFLCLYLFLRNPDYLRIPFFLLGVLIIVEVFFRFHVYPKTPFVTVLKNEHDIYASFTVKAIRSLDNSGISLQNAFKEEPVIFMLNKAEIKKEEIAKVNLKTDDLANYAFELVKNIKGEYVTAFDIFTSYLLLTEDQTKLLFNKGLKKEELTDILVWAKRTFPKFDKAEKKRASFFGEGIAEDWVFGWTIETKKYTLDLTSEIANKNYNLYDRTNEYKRIIEALAANKSVLMVGEPGVGKKAIVSQFAYDSFSGIFKGRLNYQRFFQLMVDAFLAGAENQGQLEERLDAVIIELAHAGNVILYVSDFENILGASTYKLDLSAALIPYLEKGLIRIVATTTHGSYKKFIEPLHELLSVFDVIKLDEPEKDLTLPMLFEKANQLEKRGNTDISYKAILAAIEFGAKYSKNQVLPGAAALLLEDTVNANVLAGKKKISDEDILNQAQKETKAKVGEPRTEEKQTLLHLEEQIHKKVIDQDEAVSAVSEAVRRIRSGLVNEEKPISFLFLGPTGVGKTETAKALAEIYFEGETNMIRVDMSEFSSDDAAERLLGDTGLTDQIFENPSSLVLLDEFEKANQDVLNLFLQVFDDGRLTDNKGKTVSFLNSIIIATSNAASEFIREEVKKGIVIDKTFHDKLLEFLQTKGIFKPELLNRFDEIITFKPLSEEDLSQVITLLLNELKQKMEEKDIYLSFDNLIINKIGREGFDEQFGARPLRRYIQDNIEDLLAQKLLKDEIKRGEKILVSVDRNDQIIFTPAT